jgi:hypothetical protein
LKEPGQNSLVQERGSEMELAPQVLSSNVQLGAEAAKVLKVLTKK